MSPAPPLSLASRTKSHLRAAVRLENSAGVSPVARTGVNRQQPRNRAQHARRMELARKILDELMGAERNKMAHERGGFGVRFSDAQVCKHALVGACPYELFANTKSDIGACPCRHHDPGLRAAFEQSSAGAAQRAQYEREYLALLEQLVADLERKMRRGKDRISTRLDDPGRGAPSAATDEAEERRIIIDLQIKELLVQIDACGAEGRIRQAQELTARLDALRAEAAQLLRGATGVVAPGGVDMHPLHKLEKQMELCPTCGALLIVGDAPKRVEAFRPGMIEYLKPGEDVKFGNPSSDANYAAYMRTQLHAIAAGLGITYEQLTGDLSQVNYSSLRAGLVEFRRMIETLRWQVFIPMFCVPVWRRFIERAYLAGAITKLDYNASWTPMKFEMIDPLKDAQADTMMMRNGTLTLKEAIARHGFDPEQQLQEIADTAQKLDAYGLVLDSDPRTTAKSGIVQTPNDGASNDQTTKPANE